MQDRNEYHLQFFKKREVFTTIVTDYELLHRGKENPSPDNLFRT